MTVVHDILDSAAAAWGERPAVSTSSETVTYRDLARRSELLACWLADRAVCRGDRVMLCMNPSVELAGLVYACSRVGAMFVVVGTDTPASPLEALLRDCAPALMVADTEEHSEVAERLGIASASTTCARAAAAAAGSWRPRRVLAVDPVCLIYTSGSTAAPKAVVSGHSQVVFAATQVQRRLGYQATDRVLGALPMSFDYGLYQLFLCAQVGAELCLGHERVISHQLVRVLSEARITVLPAVPLLAHLLGELLCRGTAADQAARCAKLGSLRLLTSTGAAMPSSVLAALRQALPQLRVQLMYGLTECKRVSIMNPDEDLGKPGASGRPLDGTEVYAIDDSGRRLGPGELGELVVRGPHVMLGYWRAPAESARRFPVAGDLARELHTGDLGWVGEDGQVYCRGRLDGIYKQYGTRVSITEVEAAAHRTPRVRAAAVVPPADPLAGAILIAVTDAHPHEVLNELRAFLPAAKMPSRCVVVETLPWTKHRKLDRTALARVVG